tara:strand:- start:520 stop:1107 length:588 start_codon:yes stop_codon:yes gene_type:complete
MTKKASVLNKLIESGTDKLKTHIRKKANAKELKKQERSDYIFNNLSEDIQKRIKNKERNIIKKDRKTKEELSESRKNTIFRDPTAKSYERYLDLQLDEKSRSKALKELKINEEEIKKDLEKYLKKESQKRANEEKTGKELTKARDERKKPVNPSTQIRNLTTKLKDGGSVNKKKPVKKKAMKKSGKGTKWESKWG